MANYINVTLDTTAPSGVSVTINNGEEKTSLNAVSLAITCTDEDLTGYQMKIWGVDGAETEDAASWESFSSIKNVTLSTGDGEKTIYVKVRDDVWNESGTVSDTIGYYTTVPTVELELPGGFESKISLLRYSPTGFLLSVSENIDAVKIMIVDDVNASYDDASNIAIPSAPEHGTAIKQETPEDEFYLQSEYMEFTDIEIDSSVELVVTVAAEEILSASPGDGVKTIKAFVRSAASGNWSE